ncbi:hypothetical protein AMATHDRAFT_142895 [Amanita thiersii Skay4041]|uniref:MutL C-terminal dimerisation domain-containing protein n=1 Tax=Amanita thiersii Skay4041 TaxID=703135 RepID=A0A2A9NSM8_9AGAR|nr:hypothetical protein AMATHDRAFT_142895 [Amanita thiersii Skay4041]
MPIRNLPPPTRASLRSSQILSSLPQIISELLQNSLDAGARHIEVGVDCDEWACWVRDNGVGITRDALNIIGEGSDNGRYFTSKPHASHTINALETFGFRGEALASIASLSCIEICSRIARSRDTWSVILKGEKSLYNGPAVRWRRESPGTVVHVRDAFYNLPVRRRSHPAPSRTMDQIRQELECYALIFPHVSFTLEDIQSQKRAGSSEYCLLRIPKTSSTLAAFQHLYGKAFAKHVEDINSVSGEMKIGGFISLVGTQSRIYQFLYVNNHIMSQGELHKVVDSVFSKSTFHRNAPSEEEDTGLSRPVNRRSPRKCEKRPVYVLNLVLSPEKIDNCLEPNKSAVHFQDLSLVKSFLASTVRDFLLKHGYLSDTSMAEVMPNDSGFPHSRKKRKLYKSDDELGAGYINKRASHVLINPNEEISQAPCANIRKSSVLQKWTDGRTGQTFLIDTRTGNTCNEAASFQEAPGYQTDNQRKERRTILLPDLLSPESKGLRECATPEWIEEVLKSNSAYIPAESVVPRLSGNLANNESWKSHLTFDCNFLKGYENRESSRFLRFQKSDLARARVVGQVDRKFIACLLTDPETQESHGLSFGDEHVGASVGQCLVLIDQHAADERIRVEYYLKELCLGFLDTRRHGQDSKQGVKLHLFDPLLPLLLTRHEALKLVASKDVQEYLGFWGIQFSGLSEININGTDTDIENETDHEYIQVLVKSVPEIVSEKLVMKDELRDLVKSVLGGPESDRPDGQCVEIADHSSNDFSWFNGLRCCPAGLLNLINSKACRGQRWMHCCMTKRKLMQNIRCYYVQ